MATTALKSGTGNGSGKLAGSNTSIASKTKSKPYMGSTDRLSKLAKSKAGSFLDLKKTPLSKSISLGEKVKSISDSHHELSFEEEFQKRVEHLALPFEMLKRGLSELGPAPEGNKLFSGLQNMWALREYPYIQHLELQGNNLSDLSILGHLRYLATLDLSSNKLTEALAFSPPPHNLQRIDLSRNQISHLGDLSVHRFMTSLCLDRNLIKSLNGLSKCHRLKHLSVTNNGVTSIEALKGLPLETLDIRSNRITTLAGVETLLSLQELRVSHNSIRSITELKNHATLKTLDLEANQIDSMEDIMILQSLPRLRILSLKKNPVTTKPSTFWQPEGVIVVPTSLHVPSYRLRNIFLLPYLSILDTFPVSTEEKMAAGNLYDPHPHVVASLQHAHQQTKQAKSYAKIKAEDLVRARRLRPIVLCGPSGAGKRTLTNRLLTEFPHIYGLSISHTTRRPRPGEDNGVHYHFISRPEMEKMIEEGAFIECVTLFGNIYGTSMDAVDKVTEEGKVCIMDLEIEGVLALRKSHLRARYVFITLPNMNVLQERLQNRVTNQPPAKIKAEEAKPPASIPGSIDSIVPSASASTVSIADPPPQVTQDNVSGWLNKAKHEEHDYQNITFDFTVLNDDLERAYKQLKDFCLDVYWKDFDEED